jgi:hypothetical protein
MVIGIIGQNYQYGVRFDSEVSRYSQGALQCVRDEGSGRAFKMDVSRIA